MTLRKKWNHLRKLVNNLGIPAAFKYLVCHSLNLGTFSQYWIKPKGILHALCVRRNTSDIHVFKQIFVDREYECLNNLNEVGLVIDCGANVGYSSAYFLSTYPTCSVIAVEPDASNFVALEQNLTAYGDRVKLMKAGVWSEAAPLKISQNKYRDGAEWTRQVTPCKSDEQPDVQGIDIGSLLACSGYCRISLLKMDIEGSEAIVFSTNYEHWIDRVDNIAIELHDDSKFGKASDVFFSAIRGRGFQVSHSGELTICQRLPYHPTSSQQVQVTSDLKA